MIMVNDLLVMLFFFFFFFQAEDGIRDRDVTGVQTCALPIYQAVIALIRDAENEKHGEELIRAGSEFLAERSEERRVGKECRSRWSRYHKKKKRNKNKENEQVKKLNANKQEKRTAMSLTHYDI